ncbi:metallopeptidase family protein [Ornithinicoccus hortensis]
MSGIRRRDRHGHGMRGPLAWPRVPLMTSRARVFDEMVLDAVASLERRLERQLDGLEVAVEDVPPSDPSPWETRVALGRLFPAQGSLPTRVVLYRRPLETRAQDPAELAAMIYEVLAEQVASMLGMDPEDLF